MRYLPLAALCAAAVALWIPFLPWASWHAVHQPYDIKDYIAVAKGLRHFALLGKEGYLSTVFPPGYPLLLALLPLPLRLQVAPWVALAAFLASLAILHSIVRHHANPFAAFVACLLWLGVFLSLPREIEASLSEVPFLLALVCALGHTNPFPRGALAAFACLIRPEGWLALPAIAWFTQSWRKRAIIIAVALALNLPYLFFLHHHLHRWTLTGKDRYNQTRAPYMAARIPWQGLSSLVLPDKTMLPPTSPQARRLLGTGLSQKAIRLQSAGPRITANAVTAAHFTIGFPRFLLLIGFVALPLALAKHHWLHPYALALLPPGLFWLLFWYSPRFLFPLFFLACLTLSQWPLRPVRPAGWPRLRRPATALPSGQPSTSG